MPTSKVIDVQELINAHKLSAVQVTLLVLCFLIFAIDGESIQNRGVLIGWVRVRAHGTRVGWCGSWCGG